MRKQMSHLIRAEGNMNELTQAVRPDAINQLHKGEWQIQDEEEKQISGVLIAEY